MFLRTFAVIAVAAISAIGCSGKPATPASTASQAAASPATLPASAPKPAEANGNNVSPERKQQLRALFEPLRQSVLQFQKEQSAFLDALERHNDAALERTTTASEKAMATIQAGKREILSKATALGATIEQVEAEWTIWLGEVRGQDVATK